MEENQKSRIVRNIARLIRLTRCTPLFIAEFEQSQIFDSSDVEEIEAEGRNHGDSSKSKKFYEIIQTRTGGFEILLTALGSTRQTGALDILTEPEISNPVRSSKFSRIVSFVKSPDWTARLSSSNYQKCLFIVYSEDCSLSARRLHETMSNIREYSVEKFITDFSSREALCKEDNSDTLHLVNSGENILRILQNGTASIPNKTILLTDKGNKIDDKIIQTLSSFAVVVKMITDNFKWNDLSYYMQDQIITNVQNILPSHQFTQIARHLESTVMIDLINGKIPKLLCDSFPDEISFYIPRYLIIRCLIAESIFDTPSTDIFLLTGIERHQLTKYVKDQGSENSGSYLNQNCISSSRFIILEDASHFEKIANLVNVSVHLLDYNRPYFIWKMSKGSMTFLQQHVIETGKQNLLNEEDFVEAIESRASFRQPVCISDTPGMGKTILLAQIGRILQKRYWSERDVIFLRISEFTKILKAKLETNDMSSAVLLSLLECSVENSMGSAVLKYLLETQSKKIELLFDGYDELNANDVSTVFRSLEVIKHSYPSIRVWVTTRPHLMTSLENFLEVFGFHIKPFDDVDQVNFLQSYWSHENDDCDTKKLETAAGECLRHVKSKLNSGDQDIAGIPLQCLLIGEIFSENAQEYALSDKPIDIVASSKVTSIASLYNLLIEKKFLRYTKRYGKDNIDGVGLWDIHVYLSLCLLFPSHSDYFRFELNASLASLENLLDVGLLEYQSTLEQPRFLHRTIAEYFASTFYFQKITSDPTPHVLTLFVRDVMSNKGVPTSSKQAPTSASQFIYRVICYFVNSFLDDPTKYNVKYNEALAADTALPSIVTACAYHDFENLFNFIDKVTNGFGNFRKEIFDTTLLCIGCKSSNIQFIKNVCDKFMENVNVIEERPRRQQSITTPLHQAVARGSYSLTEYLVYNKNYLNNLMQLKFSMETLIASCVENSIDDSEQTIRDKIQILRLLKDINPKLFEVEIPDVRILPVFSKNIHPDLLGELLTIGVSRYEDVITIGQVIFKCLTYLTTEDINRLLEHLCKSKRKDLLNSLVNTRFCCKPTNRLITFVHRFLECREPSDKTFQIFLNMGHIFNGEDDSYYWTTLKMAIAAHRKPVCLRKLIDLGCDYKHPKVLNVSVWYKNLVALELLLSYPDIDINSKDDSLKTALHHVVENKDGTFRNEMLELLLKKGASVVATNKDNETPLEYLLKHNPSHLSVKMLHLLVSYGAIYNPDISRDTVKWIIQRSELEQASSENIYESILTKCLEIGIDVNCTNYREDFMVLHEACQHGMLFIVKHLISNGFDPARVCDSKNTILHTALQNENETNRVEITNYILSMNDNLINMQNDVGQNPIEKALVQNKEHLNLEIVAEFCNYGVELNSKTATELLVWLFTLDISKYNTSTFKFRMSNILDVLQNRGANFNYHFEQDNSSLMHAATKNNFYDGLEYLIRLGIDVNHKNSSGETCLHTILRNNCEQNAYKICRLLVENKVNVKLADNKNKTAVEVLLEKEIQLDLEILMLLQSYGAMTSENVATKILQRLATKTTIEDNPHFKLLEECFTRCVTSGAGLDSRDENGETLLYSATKRGYVKYLELLLEHGTNTNEVSSNGDSPLHISVSIENENWRFETTTFLLENGGNPNIPNSNGHTPIIRLLNNEPLKLTFELYKLLESYGAVNSSVVATSVIVWLVKHQQSLRIDEHNFINIADYCIGKGANLLWKEDVTGDDFLHLATKYLNLHTIEYFIEKDLDVNSRNHLLQTPLHCEPALMYYKDHARNPVEIVKIFLKHGADLFATCQNGQSPFKKILLLDNTETLEHVLETCSDSRQDMNFNPIEMLATGVAYSKRRKSVRLICEWFCRQEIMLLVDIKVDVNGHQKTLLHLAAANKNAVVVEYLVIDQGFSEKLFTAEMKDILHTAVKCSDDDFYSDASGIVTLISRYNNDMLNARDDEGRTPLAVESICPMVLDTLLERGADVNLEDRIKNVALHWVFKNRNTDRLGLVDIFVKSGANLNAVNLDMESPLLLAIICPEDEKTKVQILKLLVDNGADVRIRDKNNSSVMDLITQNLSTSGCNEIVNFFRGKGYSDLFPTVESTSNENLIDKTLSSLHLDKDGQDNDFNLFD